MSIFFSMASAAVDPIDSVHAVLLMNEVSAPANGNFVENQLGAATVRTVTNKL